MGHGCPASKKIIGFYFLFNYCITKFNNFVFHKNAKSIKIELNLPLVYHNNISKFGLIWLRQTQVIERKP